MTRPPTDRERIAQLEAENAELREELAAWRANDAGETASHAALLREVALARLLQPFMVARTSARPAARVLLPLIDRPGQVLSKARLMDWLSPHNEDAWIKAVDVAICNARRGLRGLQLADAVETVWGVGLRMKPEAAARLRQLLSQAHV